MRLPSLSKKHQKGGLTGKPVAQRAGLASEYVSEREHRAQADNVDDRWPGRQGSSQDCEESDGDMRAKTTSVTPDVGFCCDGRMRRGAAELQSGTTGEAPGLAPAPVSASASALAWQVVGVKTGSVAEVF